MTKCRYDSLLLILRYCKQHHAREFYQFNVGVHSRSIGGLCDSPYHGKTWVKRVGRSKKSDGTNGRWLYRLCEWVDLDTVHIDGDEWTTIAPH